MRYAMWAMVLGGCATGGPGIGIAPTPEEAPDEAGPKLRSTPVDAPQPLGVDVFIEAVVDDPSGVMDVSIVYRRETAVAWAAVRMTAVGPTAGGTLFQGEIRGEDVKDSGIYYYLSAVDGSDAGNESCLPAQCESDAWRFNVTP